MSFQKWNNADYKKMNSVSKRLLFHKVNQSKDNDESNIRSTRVGIKIFSLFEANNQKPVWLSDSGSRRETPRWACDGDL